MDHPYKSLPDRAFWSPAVAQRNIFEIDELWKPKFKIRPNSKTATFGSCFAQHIGRALRERDFSWLNTEPAPKGMKTSSARAYNYDIFTCRTGNIYTTTLLEQWTEWALGESSPPDEVWKSDGRFFDPFRPRIEPNGFASKEEMEASRDQAIKSFLDAIDQSSLFVFTLGLTESWFDTRGWEYPMCPGTAAGQFDENRHEFRNQDYLQLRKALLNTMKMMRQRNKNIRFLLTVSPVPLIATNAGHHVLASTMYSKSVLRAVAGAIADERGYVDYFPSYEIINSPAFHGAFFEPNKRNVSAYGVNFVMDTFFKGLGFKAGTTSKKQPSAKVVQERVDEKCDEELLGAFGGGK